MTSNGPPDISSDSSHPASKAYIPMFEQPSDYHS
jgi:hypothetical protein